MLYLRSCGLIKISPAAFSGLENYLELLDLSGNNISLLPQDVFHRFELLRTLSLRDNMIENLNPTEAFNGFQFTLYKLDLSGTNNLPISIQELRRQVFIINTEIWLLLSMFLFTYVCVTSYFRLRSLRVLSLSRLTQPNISPEDFLEYGVDLEELQINYADLQSIKSNAFKHFHGLKLLDLSDNMITTIENDAFADVRNSYLN